MRNVDDFVQTNVDVVTTKSQPAGDLRRPSTRFSAIWDYWPNSHLATNWLTLLIQSAAPATAYYSAPTLLPNNRFPPWGDRRLAGLSNIVHRAGERTVRPFVRSFVSQRSTVCSCRCLIARRRKVVALRSTTVLNASSPELAHAGQHITAASWRSVADAAVAAASADDEADNKLRCNILHHCCAVVQLV